MLLIAALVSALPGCRTSFEDRAGPVPAPQRSSGRLVHHDRVPASGKMTAVWRIAEDDVWGVGENRTILHWDGRAWSTTYAEACIGCAGFEGLWASGREDVWAVGWHSTGPPWPSHGNPAHVEGHHALLHWDGTCWSDVHIPELGARTITAMHGSGRDDIWLTTMPLDRGPGEPALALHWDGTRWTPHAIPSAERTFAPWVRSPSDAWLLASEPDRTALWHWNGQQWSRDTDVGGARDMWIADGDVWVWSPDQLRHRDRDGRWTSQLWQGELRAIARGSTVWARTATGIARWDADRWVAAQLPPRFEAHAVGGTASDAWVFGSLDGRRAALHGDGERWTTLSDATAGGVWRMSFAAPDDGWALASGSIETTPPGFVVDLLHWNGSVWDRASPPFTPLFVWASRDHQVWIAGLTEIAVGDGARWRTLPAPPGLQMIGSLWASGPEDVWIGGDGSPARWNGREWIQTAPMPKRSPRAQWTPLTGSGPDDVWGTGVDTSADGARIHELIHWDGRAWSAVALSRELFKDLEGGGAFRANAMWSAGPEDLWIVGGVDDPRNRSVILHHQRDGWTSYVLDLDPAPRQDVSDIFLAGSLWGVWGHRSDDVWAAGAGGAVFHFDGARWTELARDPDDQRAFHTVAGSAGGPPWLAGEAGALVSVAADARVAPAPRRPPRCVQVPPRSICAADRSWAPAAPRQ